MRSSRSGIGTNTKPEKGPRKTEGNQGGGRKAILFDSPGHAVFLVGRPAVSLKNENKR